MSDVGNDRLGRGTAVFQLPFVNPRICDQDWVYERDRVFVEGGDPGTRASLVDDFLVDAVGRGGRVVLGLVDGADLPLRSFTAPTVGANRGVHGLHLTPRQYDQLAARHGVLVVRAAYNRIDRAVIDATARHPADLTIVHGMPQLDDIPVGQCTYPFWVCERLALGIHGALVVTASRPIPAWPAAWPDPTTAALQYGTLSILARRLSGSLRPFRALRALRVARKGSDTVDTPYVPRSERSGEPPWMQRLSQPRRPISLCR